MEVRIAGAGPLAQDLNRRVKSIEHAGAVELIGAVGQHEVLDLYRWADGFCLPSYAEGIPVVLMEAMSTELPVVITPVGGIPELVRDRENRLLVSLVI